MRSGWLRWTAFALACLVLAALILAGLRRVNEGHAELTGQAFPPPVALHAEGHRLDLRFYDLQARVNLPAAMFRNATAAVRSFGQRVARWVDRKAAALRKANGLKPGRLLRSQ